MQKHIQQVPISLFRDSLATMQNQKQHPTCLIWFWIPVFSNMNQCSFTNDWMIIQVRKILHQVGPPCTNKLLSMVIIERPGSLPKKAPLSIKRTTSLSLAHTYESALQKLRWEDCKLEATLRCVETLSLDGRMDGRTG